MAIYDGPTIHSEYNDYKPLPTYVYRKRHWLVEADVLSEAAAAVECALDSDPERLQGRVESWSLLSVNYDEDRGRWAVVSSEVVYAQWGDETIA